ncbi:MAG: SsrA-binding protein SmpB, partial [Thermoanaerobaculia bacterium]|nr:SsrA-binding protein SmpB [Thermoanaerobaculia bacterium]
EVKSAREGKIQLKDSYVEIRNGEAWLVGAHIGAYSHGNLANHPPERDRKLLLHRREIDKIFGRTTVQGLTCIPLEVLLRGSLVKVRLALARGKRQHDKRETEKRRRLDQEAREALTRRN